ncbi:MAG: hypothetical protein GC178_05530 [Flavobacteriales bacterium]|nr:hypothetical protein [Flavobacteriales bacterium]
MKKQTINSGQQPAKMGLGKDNFSRVLLIAAVILYSISLVLLANLAMAEGATEVSGALIKVNNRLDGNALDGLNLSVKSVHGNVLSIDISMADYVKLNDMKGVCSAQLDHNGGSAPATANDLIRVKYANASVVVGVLDNQGVMSEADRADLKKVEPNANVGFISYRSDDPSSTVIIRNLKGGESNLVQALAYMQEYAATVNKPLVIEIALSGAELQNPLFVQVCQRVAESGVQFLGAPDFATGYAQENAPMQLAFSMFNSETGQITDQSDFWAISEVKGQEVMMLGSDNQTCSIRFEKEAEMGKVYLSNASNDLVMVSVLTSDGDVNYYHVENKETALIPRELLNGTPVLEDGLAGIYPFHTKKALYNNAVAENQFVALSQNRREVQLGNNSGMALNVAAPAPRTLAMALSNMDRPVNIEIRDEDGNVVYKNQPDADTQSIQTKIDLSEGAEGLYFLDLTSPHYHQTFALLMD